jgi:hypothetical protein
MTLHRGRCQCGSITFEVTADPIMAGHCHCLDCQKSSGAAHVSMIAFPAAAVTVKGKTAGYESRADSGAMVTREFCPRCGSRMFGTSSGMAGMKTVNAVAFDDPAIFKPMMTVYAKRRQAWDHLADGIPAFEAMPPAP